MKEGPSRPAENDQISINGVNFSHRDIHKVVDAFYSEIPHHPTLNVPFQSVHDWPEHIERLTHFWWIRFGGAPYLFSEYNPVPKHYFAGFNDQLLADWLKLFDKTLRTHLSPAQATMWLRIAAKIGQVLDAKNEMFRKHLESNASR